VNLFFAIWKKKAYDPLSFVKNAVTSNSYLYMITLWPVTLWVENSNDFIFQQDGVVPHFDMAV
jgi:hypothetical protein